MRRMQEIIRSAILRSHQTLNAIKQISLLAKTTTCLLQYLKSFNQNSSRNSSLQNSRAFYKSTYPQLTVLVINVLKI